MLLYGTDKDWIIGEKKDRIFIGHDMLAGQISIVTSDFNIINVDHAVKRWYATN